MQLGQNFILENSIANPLVDYGQNVGNDMLNVRHKRLPFAHRDVVGEWNGTAEGQTDSSTPCDVG